jgi:hypothetical protein
MRGELSRAASLLGRNHEVEVTVIDAVRRRDGTTLRLEPDGRTPALPSRGRFAARVAERPAVVARLREQLGLEALVRRWDGALGDELRVVLGRPLAPVSTA